MQYGEILTLGRHKLMCGDATNRDDVMRLIGDDRVNLVLTDPPYGIRSVNHKTGKIGGGSRGFESKVYPEVIGDYSTEMFRDHYQILRTNTLAMIIWGGQNFTDILPPVYGWIVWDKAKNCETLSFSDCELAWSNLGSRVRKYVQRWNGYVRDGDKTLNAKVHPNQKPVELHMKILEDFSQPDNVILDCFGGSGTTLIACEMTGRKCLMMEISPEYCGIIAERFNKLKEELRFTF